MNKVIKTQLVLLGGLLTALTFVLAACGGGGSSAGAGGGGTTVFGSVNNGTAALTPGQFAPMQSGGVLVALGDLVVPRAEAAVYSVTVDCSAGGGYVKTENTDITGKFTFVGDATLNGSCDILVDGTLVTTILVTSGTKNEVEINDNGGSFVLAKPVETESSGGNIVEVEVEDENSDQASSDDNSSDQASSDDDSSDANPVGSPT